MIFFFDFSFLLIVMLILGAGSAAATAQWVLNHIFIICVVIIVKTLILFGVFVFQKGRSLSYNLLATTFIAVDIVRNGYLFACMVRMLGDMFSGGVWGFIIGVINVVYGGMLLLLAAEAPIYPIYDSIALCSENKELKLYIALEIVAIIALIIVSLWGGVWES